ncbi:MAG: DsrE family protein [Anaerolineaceae bacterium]|nr:DsrE family protein [Anaerolineaceae bacterium]
MEDVLNIVWTSADPDVAKNMVFMYCYNSKKHEWWQEVHLVIWGPSAKLAAENEEIQERLAAMKEIGVNLWACKACADNYGVSDALSALGVQVEYMGIPLTNVLKANGKLLTF